MRIVSLFSGAGGLDRGFELSGFNTIWANEYDREIWETYQKNFPHVFLEKRSITDLSMSDIPDCEGIIGGPPCQSWSEAGTLKGIHDKRGKLFFNFIDILQAKKPLFFLAENVSGMLASRHRESIHKIKELLIDAGYNLSFDLLNACNYNVPQDRKRVFFVGFRKDIDAKFAFPEPHQKIISLKESILDLQNNVIPALDKNYTNGSKCRISNHEYMIGGFSTIYMSRNRVRNWEEVSFTIQAGGRHAPLHPQAPKMIFVEKDKRAFIEGKENLYRRLSIRECARIQTFPDDHIFYYTKLAAGYKMVGNAVPCNLAYCLAESIKKTLGK